MLDNLRKFIRKGTEALLRVLLGPALNIVFTGTDDRVLEWFVCELEAVEASSRKQRLVEIPVLGTRNSLSRVFFTWDHNHLCSLVSPPRLWRWFRRVVCVVIVSDPRETLSSSDKPANRSLMDGLDYRLTREGKLWGLVEPGLIPKWRGLRELRRSAKQGLVELSVSDLMRGPEDYGEKILQHVPRRFVFTRRRLWERVQQLPKFVPAPAPQSVAEDDRLQMQISLRPELEMIALQEGYGAKKTPPRTSSISLDSPPEGTVIVFYTPDPLYVGEVGRLIARLELLELNYLAREVTAGETWVTTTLEKASWISSVRSEVSGPLLYLDADAYVHSNPWPHLVHLRCDLAAPVFPGGELNSSTLWINDTKGARELLAGWAQASKSRISTYGRKLAQTGDNGDQGVLREIIEETVGEHQSSQTFEPLPPNLALIFDRRGKTFIEGEVVIEQLQASRETTSSDYRIHRRRRRLQQLAVNEPS